MIITKSDFFSSKAIAAICDGNYTTWPVSDERKAGITSRMKTEIQCDIVEEELMAFIRSDKVRNAIRDFPDLAWRYVWNDLITGAEAALSEYEPGAGFDWHVDHWSRHRVLNWIVTLTDNDDYIEATDEAFPNDMIGYEPGEDKVEAIKLKRNLLVIMPSYCPHQIVAGDGRRTSIHGHFNT